MAVDAGSARAAFNRDPESLTYKLGYYSVVVPTLFRRRNRIRPDGGSPFIDGSFTVTHEEQNRWFDLFDVDSATGAGNPPFSYVMKSATMWFLRTLRSLGVNFRHVRQVG